jgi:hypothetical protein
MPTPAPSLIAVALLSASPNATPTPHPSKLVATSPAPHPGKLVAANPTPHPYPVPVIDVVKVDDKLQIRLRSPNAESKVVMETAYKLDYASLVAKDSKRPTTTGTVYPKVEIAAAAKIEALDAPLKLASGEQRLVSIGCDGEVSDGSSHWKLEGTSSFLLPGGAKLTLTPSAKGKARACGRVDVIHGNERVRLTGRGSTVKIGKLQVSGVVTDNKHPAGDVYLKVEAASHKLDGRTVGWAVLEHKAGTYRTSGIVFDAGDGVSRSDGYYQIKMSNVIVSSVAAQAEIGGTTPAGLIAEDG